MLNVSALLLDDALEPATPVTNGAISETLRQFAALSDDRLLQLVDCRESPNSPEFNLTSKSEANCSHILASTRSLLEWDKNVVCM